MSKKTYLYRYLLIIKKVRVQPYITFEEIADYIETELFILGEDREAFSKRTFQRDVADIRQMFNIDIVFDRAQKGYYIFSDEDTVVFDRMFEAFDIFQSMTQTNSLKNYFHFDHNRPTGTQFLRPIIEAIKDRKMVQFVYLKHWNKPSTRMAKPLVLKEYKGRWYLFCILKGETEVKTFALDRIESLFETNEKYSFPQDWNADAYFEYCFGIYRPQSSEANPQEVLFETNQNTANYLLSQPLHKSQKVVSEKDGVYQFSMKIYITYDLEMELLSLGDNIRIISPIELKKKILSIHKKSFEKLSEKTS